uniref:Rad21/Rec8-like protein C-terminal eukaryotic domain-containing protein n=1 Tax=Poecilia mexicana TaxID=48701 RepID=A0A3B3Y046_9TELE
NIHGKTSEYPAFSLLSLCRGNTRSQAAATFLSLLVLKKQQIVVLHQPGPYLDVSVAPGPKYYT